MFARFEYQKYFALEPKEKLNFILDGQTTFQTNRRKDGNLIRNGKERFKENDSASKGIWLSVLYAKAFEIRDDLASSGTKNSASQSLMNRVKSARMKK